MYKLSFIDIGSVIQKLKVGTRDIQIRHNIVMSQACFHVFKNGMKSTSPNLDIKFYIFVREVLGSDLGRNNSYSS
jgi:hypothetical protein